MKKIIISLLLFNNSFSFDSKECSRKVFFKGNGAGMFLSTTSFVSSTGDCAMIGDKSHDEKVFFIQNLDEIKIDVARGDGDYLTAFNSHSSCQSLGSQLQKKYENIFVQDMESSFNNLKKASCE